jgi:2-methylaconitate cis-trans-isomerase PrpF
VIAGLAHALGAPCPTAVLDLSRVSADRESLIAELAEVRSRLTSVGFGSVLKLALVAPSERAGADLDYRFVQALPGDLTRLDFSGTCGHSVLAAVTVAAKVGWIPAIDDRRPVRVRLLNNDGAVVCGGRPTAPYFWRFDVEFVNQPPVPLAELLMTRRPVDEVRFAGSSYPVSLVSMGNPYVFVAAASLGLDTRAALFAAGDQVQQLMLGIRRAAAELVGWPSESTFPKVAAVGAGEDRRLFVRAVSVPTWHPTIALTGASCLAAAAAIPGTIPHTLATRAARPRGQSALLDVDTPGGPTAVASRVSAEHPGGALSSVSISGKDVLLLSPPVLAEPSLTVSQR